MSFVKFLKSISVNQIVVNLYIIKIFKKMHEILDLEELLALCSYRSLSWVNCVPSKFIC